MEVKSIAECSQRAFCYTPTCNKLLPVFKSFVLSIFEWPLKTGFAVFLFFSAEVDKVHATAALTAVIKYLEVRPVVLVIKLL